MGSEKASQIPLGDPHHPVKRMGHQIPRPDLAPDRARRNRDSVSDVADGQKAEPRSAPVWRLVRRVGVAHGIVRRVGAGMRT